MLRVSGDPAGLSPRLCPCKRPTRAAVSSACSHSSSSCHPGGRANGGAGASFGEAARAVAPAWAGGTLGGVAFRALGKGALPPPPFVVVSLISTLVFLGAHRAARVALGGEAGGTGASN